MRPLRLNVRAFGPYAAEQVFDFTALGARSFFLIHGPTGAGKTSILDAICFALYGDTSGGAREAERMRSDHADSKTPTEVTFDFALGEQSYRVRRSPRQPRPKKRGAGFTMQDTEATLWRRTAAAADNDEGQPLADGWADVTDYVVELMGFRCDQFRQVVLLPQGQFQKLLMDRTDHRQSILEALFRVERFKRIEQALKDAATDVSKRTMTLRTRRDENLRQSGAATVEQLQEQLATLEAQAIEAAANVKQLAAARDAAQQALNEALTVVAKLKARDDAIEALRKLESRREEFATKQVEHDRAVRAAGLADAESAMAQRLREAAAAKKERDEKQKMLAQAEAQKKQAEDALVAEGAKEEMRQRGRRRVDELEAMVARLAELEAARKQFDEADAGASAHAKEREKLAKSLEKYRDELRSAEKHRQEAQASAASAQSLALELKNAKDTADRAAKLRDCREELQRERKRSQMLSESRKSLRKKLDDAERACDAEQAAWAVAQAALLAATLEDGQPCPVCGSLHHPRPAHAGDALPRQDEMELRQAEVKSLRTKLEKIITDAAEVDAAARAAEASAVIHEQALGDLAAVSPEELRRRVELIKQKSDKAEQDGIDVAQLAQRIERLTLQVGEAERRAAQAEQTAATAAAQRAGTKAVLDKCSEAVPPELRSPETLEAERRRVGFKLKQLTYAWEAAQEAAKATAVKAASAGVALSAADEVSKRAAEAADAHRREFEKRLSAEGFPDLAAYQQARRTAAQVQRLEAEIRQYNIDVGTAKNRAQTTALEAASLVAPDLLSLQAAARDADIPHVTAARQEGTLRGRLKQIEDWLRTIAKIDADLVSLDATYQVVGKLADVATGQNFQRISFQRYVLGVFLDEVLDAATARLRIMSRGRFALQRARESADARLKAGLDIEACDTFTGTARPVSTLSGGESFLASLALALGLADVVQSHAGGVRLDTIFVDEGFGTLDPESLDLAIRALQDLQQGGRLVGIISHVAELKELIPARLEVLSDRHGSTARFVLA